VHPFFMREISPFWRDAYVDEIVFYSVRYGHDKGIYDNKSEIWTLWHTGDKTNIPLGSRQFQ
jgi:hypothetical protein